MREALIQLDSRDEAVLLFGTRDQHLHSLRDALGLQVIGRGDQILLKGTPEQVGQAERAFSQLRLMLRQQGSLSAEDVQTVVAVVQQGGERIEVPGAANLLEGAQRFLRPRTDGQARYVRAMSENDLTLCVGPAGTGKTWLAVAMAVSMLRQAKVKKIVLVRPAVEAGERLGYLPGDMVAKVNPYLRPLFDALNDMMEPDQVKRYMENDIIEIVPLAFMRGRAQPLSSKVLTPTGYVPMGSLRVGDCVVGSDGEPTLVQGVFPQGVKDVFRVTLSDGSSTRCCGEHLWTVQTCDDRSHGRGWRVVQTREMMDNLWSHHQHRYEIPLLSKPVAFPAQEVPMDPYALGLLLGDGCLTGQTTPSFTTADKELVGALQGTLEGVYVRQKTDIDYVLNREDRRRGPLPNPVSKVLRELELWGTRSSTKFVPERYLFNSPEVRLAILQGLLDSDGGPSTQQGRSCRIQYSTTSERLRDDVMFLVRSLGGVATTRIRRAKGRTPGRARGRAVPYRSDSHVMDLRLPEHLSPFRLRRKADCYAEAGGGRPMRFIHDIQADGKEECACIQVGARDSLYATDDFILTHNTLNQAAIILDEAQNTTIPQMKMFLTRMGNDSKIIVTGDVTQVDLPKQMRSGLVDVLKRLRDLKNVALVYLHGSDIVRNALVQKILEAYEDPSSGRKKRD